MTPTTMVKLACSNSSTGTTMGMSVGQNLLHRCVKKQDLNPIQNCGDATLMRS